MNPHVKKLFAGICLSLAGAAMLAPVLLVGAAGRGFTAYGGGTAEPGALAFSSASYAVTEGAGSAKIRLKRTGGTDGEVVGKVTLADVSTSPADYRFTPGARDASFNPGGSGTGGISPLAVQPDGKIIIGGSFTAYNGDASAPDRIMRLNADGTRDASFNPGGSGADGGDRDVFAVEVQPDGKIIIGGQFTAYNGDASAPDGVMRLNADGTRDTSFNPGGSGAGGVGFGAGYVAAVVLQPDGKVLIGGSFSAYNGDASVPDGVMRLNADGTRDTSFNQGGSGVVLQRFVGVVVVQPDGKIIIGGSFTAYNGDASAPDGVMRLNADGTRDTSFNQGGSGVGAFVFVAAAAVQPGGKIIIGGLFTAYNGDGLPPNNVMRLNADGTWDTSFNSGGAGTAGFDGSVMMAVAQPDGKVIIGGFFDSYNGDGSAPDGVMRLNADGTRDTSFNQGGSGVGSPSVRAAVVQPDGKIVIATSFVTDYNGDSSVPDGVMRLDGDLFATWPEGDASEKLILLPVVDDGIVEGDETLTLTLSSVSGGATLGAPPSATLTIGGPHNPIDDAQNFVRQHYYDFLNREPDPQGFAFWTDQMTNCGNPNLEVCRINVSAAFFLSIEFQRTGFLVHRIYTTAYGRGAAGLQLPTHFIIVRVPIVRFNEFMSDTQKIRGGVIVGTGAWEQQLEANTQAFALDFVRRERFRAAYPPGMTAADFVQTLNTKTGNVLTAAEMAQFAAVFGGPTASSDDDPKRAQVLLAIADHPTLAELEFTSAFVLMQYFGYLRRDPDAAPDRSYNGYKFWLDKLGRSSGDYIDAEMVKAFLNSDEYRHRFGP